MLQKKGRLRRIVLLAGVNGVALIVAAIVFELVVGSWFSAGKKIARLRVRRDVKWVLKSRGADSSEARSVFYSRDAHGFRGHYPDVSNIDILTIGGSTTDQITVSDGETWQDVLAAEFRSNGRNVSVVNAGVDGESSIGMIRNFDWWFPTIPRLKARYCLAYVGVNDFFIEGSEGLSSDDLLGNKDQNTAWRRIEENSALYDLRRRFAGFRLAAGHVMLTPSYSWKTVNWTDTPLQQNHEAWMQPRLKAYGVRLRALDAKIRAFGAEPIFVTQRWSRYRVENGRIYGVRDEWTYEGRKINGVDHYYIAQLLNQKALEIARETGARGIDLGSELAIDVGDFLDWCHTNPEGARKIGKYLHIKLRDLP